MAYGNYCSVCGGTVDNVEFDFARNMCKECVIEQEKEELRRTEVSKILNSDFEQMVLEV
ncbi:MAG TPA: hypothetical protein H9742_14325 [Candidatus Acetatifactor stercoripullorum]|uniref:Uncharacterized protein n=1 Tax=Candidatus Acetatifactor stercoripullorum TaxID=2838414 RepID=A0A9D1R8Y2_9FIRM|nr:hypothetical protein [Candidatus Acetatifactor stercoripullorum]